MQSERVVVADTQSELSFISAANSNIAPFIVVLLMLVLKPNGLFGEQLRKKV